MACPIAAAATLASGAAGVITLVVHDRPFRTLARFVALMLVAGWAAYFTLGRSPSARIALEAATMITLAAGAGRVAWLARRERRMPPAFEVVGRALAPVAPVFTSPFVLTIKVWLAAMVVMEWRGKAHFASIEYAAITVALLAAVAIRWSSLRRRPRFATLESIARAGTAPSCPLGFTAPHPRSIDDDSHSRGDGKRLEPAAQQ